MSHNNLKNYYEQVFGLAHHHKYDINTVESMIPYERDVYIDLIVNYNKSIEERMKLQQQR